MKVNQGSFSHLRHTTPTFLPRQGAHLQVDVKHDDLAKHLWRVLVRSLIIGLDVLLPDLLRNPGLSFWVKLVFIQGVNLSLPGRHLLRLLSLHESAKQLGHPSSEDKEQLCVSVPQGRGGLL